MMRLLALRELRSLFALPSTWFVLAILQFALAWFYLVLLENYLNIQPQLAQLPNAPGTTSSIAVPMFNTLVLLLMMIVPMFTMRLIAEERRNQTLPLLLAAPISDTRIVLGKFCGMLVFMLVLSAGMPLMIYALALGTHLDHGLILGNLLGVVLIAASYVALGLYISSLTAQPIIAAIGTLVVLLGLWLADIGATSPDSPWHLLSPFGHFQNLNAGLLDSGDIVYFILFISLFLTLTVRRLGNNRRYG